MTFRRDDETLQAYGDGALSPDAVLQVEKWLAEDAKACERLADQAGRDALLRAALSQPLDEAPPERFLAAIDQAISQQRRQSWQSRRRFAIAASILLLLASVPAAYFWGRYEAQGEITQAATTQAGARSELDLAISTALETQLSGQPLLWSASSSDSAARIEVLRTYRSAGGLWCREYRLEATLEGKAQTERAIACRAADEKWYRLVELIEPEGLDTNGLQASTP